MTEHHIYLGNRGNSTQVFQPWGRCLCGLTLEDAQQVLEHADTTGCLVTRREQYERLRRTLR